MSSSEESDSDEETSDTFFPEKEMKKLKDMVGEDNLKDLLSDMPTFLERKKGKHEDALKNVKMLVMDKRPFRTYESFFPDAIFVLSLFVSFVAMLVQVFYLKLAPAQSSDVYFLGTCAKYLGHMNVTSQVARFYGIPYAIPPLDFSDHQFRDLFLSDVSMSALKWPNTSWRFRAPDPADSDAVHCIMSHADRCKLEEGHFQCNLTSPREPVTCTRAFTQVQSSDENCLHLDVAIPPYASDAPVVVMLSSDGMIFDQLEPPEMVDRAYQPSDQAVVDSAAVWVRLNVRSHIYSRIPKGLAFKHQEFHLLDFMAALDWIQRNVQQLGGNAKRITILAHGSASVTVLLCAQQELCASKLPNVWLSSPQFHWPAGGPKNKKKPSIPYEFFTWVQKKYTHNGALCSDDICVNEVMQKLNEKSTNDLMDEMPTLRDLLSTEMYYRKGLSIEFLRNLTEQKSWFSDLDRLDAEEINRSNRKYGRTMVVSHTADELDGHPTIDDPEFEQTFNTMLRRINADDFIYQKLAISGAVDHLSMIRYLSTLRYYCPKMLFLRDMGRSYRLYDMLHCPMPKKKIFPVPGINSVLRFSLSLAFRGIDMLAITGHTHRLHLRGGNQYVTEAQKTFFHFVKTGTMPARCRYSPETGYSGCELGSYGFKYTGLIKTLQEICEDLDFRYQLDFLSLYI